MYNLLIKYDKTHNKKLKKQNDCKSHVKTTLNQLRLGLTNPS